MAGDDVYNQLKAIFATEASIELQNAKELAKEHASNLKRKIKKDSPKRKGGKEEYAKGWKDDTAAETEFYVKIVVANEDYRLPHLLEKSHRIIVPSKDGSGYVMRDTGKETKPHPHIVKNSEDEFEKFYQDLTKADRATARFKARNRLKGGGSK